MSTATNNTPAWTTEATEAMVDREDRTHPKDLGCTTAGSSMCGFTMPGRCAGPRSVWNSQGFRHDSGEDFADSVLVWERDNDDTNGKCQRLCLLASDARRPGEQLVRAADLLGQQH